MATDKVLVFYKNPSIASLLSFFYMGAGQVYNGQKRKGILFISIYTVSIILIPFMAGFITTPILWMWGMIDARRSAGRINRALAFRLSEEKIPADTGEIRRKAAVQ